MDDMSKRIKTGSYNTMDLDKDLLSGLTRMGYKVPTPVQRKTLPIALAGMDAVCMARTGSGKTAAFLVPMLQKFPKHDSTAGIRGIVLSPTRELAVQTFRFVKDMSKFMDVRVASIIGGDAIEPQFEALSNRPDIIIATPGRLVHLLSEISTFSLKSVKYLVFDEADRLFEMGFAEQLNTLVKECSGDRQTLLFSATMPRQLLHKTSDELRMAFFAVRSNEKMAALLTVVYGSMDQDLRTTNLKSFRQGKIPYLIVTDLAARGIDVPLLNNVINLHFPSSPKLFVHRCGRAARQGRIGYAFSIVEPEEMAYLVDVHTFLGKEVSNTQGYTLEEFLPEHIHTGVLPQDALDEENDFVQRVLNDDEQMLTMARIANNGMQQYRRTRNEATPKGVSGAKKLLKNHDIVAIHPLICGVDPGRCQEHLIEKANFVRVLQTFRPAQTVLETGVGSQTDGVSIMRALRKTTTMSLERNKEKKKAMYEAFLKQQASSGQVLEKASTVSHGEETHNASNKAESSKKSNGDGDGDGDNASSKRKNGSKAVTSKRKNVEVEHAESARMSVAERRRLKKGKHQQVRAVATDGSGDEQGETTLVDGYERGSNRFADSRFYMSYGTEDEKAQFAEESLQVHSGLKTSEAQHAAMMEAAMLDLNPDDAEAMNNKRRIMRWDAKKRKYVKQSLSEIANLKGQSKSRSESGGAGKGKSSKPAGEIYNKWTKKTHREINTFKVMSDIGTDYGNGADGRPIPKFKHNLDVPSELKTEEQIRKAKKEHENLRIKNLPKAKRKSMEHAAKKKKRAGDKADAKKTAFVHKAARKQVKAIVTGRR
eukprot:GSChrysophyteH1.ASY1.ANO1.2598.1 assembled CDS